MTEQWSKWEPIGGLSRKYNIESIADSMNGFELLLSDIDDKKKRVQVLFEYSPGSYQRTKAIYKFKLFCDLEKQYGADFHRDWTFFKVSNSSYVQLLSEGSCGITDGQRFIHFSFLAANSVVDILIGDEPIVQFIENK